MAPKPALCGQGSEQPSRPLLLVREQKFLHQCCYLGITMVAHEQRQCHANCAELLERKRQHHGPRAAGDPKRKIVRIQRILFPKSRIAERQLEAAVRMGYLVILPNLGRLQQVTRRAGGAVSRQSVNHLRVRSKKLPEPVTEQEETTVRHLATAQRLEADVLKELEHFAGTILFHC